jgi:hypothetical protein
MHPIYSLFKALTDKTATQAGYACRLLGVSSEAVASALG